MIEFYRSHHQKIALVLHSLNGTLLHEHRCYFGGGTAIALKYGEYRESVDMDFLISDLSSYRQLRALLTGPYAFTSILRTPENSYFSHHPIRADQYGIRTILSVLGQPIKFEIVFESRMPLADPGSHDMVCGVATLTSGDMVASKLLANSDRWRDESVFSRDIIDLAMLHPSLGLLRQALAKAEQAYGQSIREDANKAIDFTLSRPTYVDRCLQALSISVPKAQLWQRMKELKKKVVQA
ncbi:nucleotidyl transferase AbiEii/AbiGii toxin family protein [Desulfofustis limnaeus]|jgi:hypothetical protein|uniref:Nucleotidyl transferase AbiEii/AbiGii toxin family protein n=1 Tax=Desulfofustis limnaeus TaxID=2740163 RepID=A0ABM7W9R4_9BACT|nr:nucleotidyl transferase AbiEii/AbiGii toxin family protein [Desulfofustis limnaeus]BDD87679.1 hypothetical protein DPPLL_20440 [Desulfofustis limnaeus]